MNPAPFKWDPPPGKYLIMECHVGQASNRLRCVQNHILMAGLLHRTLVIDDTQLDSTNHHYNLTLLVNVRQIKDCFGPRTITTTGEFMSQNQGQKLQADAFLCWSKACAVNWAHWKHAIGVPAISKVLRPRDVPSFTKYFVETYSNVGAIMVGDLVSRSASIPGGNASFEDVPFLRRPRCLNNATILPHPEIMRLGEEFVRETFGGPSSYIALHLRGGDIWKKCKTVPAACVSIGEAASCLVQEASVTGISKFLICTNKSGAEAQLLEKLLKERLGNSTLVVTNPELPDSAQHLEGFSKEGKAAYHKVAMAQAAVYFGTATSSFSIDVARMRFGFRTRSCRDTYICSKD